MALLDDVVDDVPESDDRDDEVKVVMAETVIVEVVTSVGDVVADEDSERDVAPLLDGVRESIDDGDDDDVEVGDVEAVTHSVDVVVIVFTIDPVEVPELDGVAEEEAEKVAVGVKVGTPVADTLALAVMRAVADIRDVADENRENIPDEVTVLVIDTVTRLESVRVASEVRDRIADGEKTADTENVVTALDVEETREVVVGNIDFEDNVEFDGSSVGEFVEVLTIEAVSLETVGAAEVELLLEEVRVAGIDCDESTVIEAVNESIADTVAVGSGETVAIGDFVCESVAASVITPSADCVWKGEALSMLAEDDLEEDEHCVDELD